MYERKLVPDQEKALHNYFIQLNKVGMPAYLHMIKQVANSLLEISSNPIKSPTKFGPLWSKHWLEKQYDLFKFRKKSLAAMYKNSQDLKMIMEYFEIYKAVVDKFGIQAEDQWNFDETEYCIGMERKDWNILVNIIWRIYSKCPANRKSFIAIECINSVERDILSMLILTRIQQLALWFNNNLNDNIVITITEIRYTNDCIFLQ